MTPTRRLVVLLAAIATGCPSDNEVKEVDSDPNGNDNLPQIQITPDELYYDELDAGQSQTLSFTVGNVGAAELEVASMTLYGASSFQILTSTGAFTLAPTQTIDVQVSFSPQGPEERAQIEILSNDVGNPQALVDLEGTGRYPELRIQPDPLDFGSVLLGCSRSETISLTNVGRAPLEISALALVGEGFTFEDPGFPRTVEVGEALDLEVLFTPTEAIAYAGELAVTSNDLVATQYATQTARGTEDGAITEEFWQGDGPWERTDILFYVDQSGSMADDHRRLQENFADFAGRLDELEMDWQVMVATKDTGCHNGIIIDAETPSAVEAFMDAVDGRGGDLTEAGLMVAEAALEESVAGGCNEGFLREGSKTMVVLVSDETDQSPGGWEVRTRHIVEAAPTASVTAIAGDVPEGCRTAEAGFGYHEASVSTGGAFLSICSNDWTDYFETIADLSATGRIDTFYLESTPDAATISVEVDDLPADGWTYDADANAVVFDAESVPESGSHIVVDYLLGGDCEG